MQNNLWGKRFAALIVDIIFLTLLMWIIVAIIYLIITASENFFVLNYWILVAIVVIIVIIHNYGRKNWLKTLGKRLFNIRVEAVEGELNYKKGIYSKYIQNIMVPTCSGCNIGIHLGDRLLDKVSKTRVVFQITLKQNMFECKNCI